MKKQYLPILLSAFLICVFFWACSGQMPSPTSSINTTAINTTPTTQPAKPQGTPASQLADPGKTVYANRCSGCHGDKGQGAKAPALIGATAVLEKYKTAQGLYKFISETMPFSAPGTLTQSEYLQVTIFLILENKFVQPNTPIEQGNMSNLALIR